MPLINFYYVLRGADFQSSIQNVKYSEKSEQEESHQATASSNTGFITYFFMIQLSFILLQVQVLQNIFIFLFQWSCPLNLPHWYSTNHNYVKQHFCFIIIKYHIYSVATHFQTEYVIEIIFVTLLCKLRTEIHFCIFKLHDTLTMKLDYYFKFQTQIFVKALIVDYENYMFWSLFIFTRRQRRVKTYFVELREQVEAEQIRM